MLLRKLLFCRRDIWGCMNLEPLKMCQSCSSGGTNHFQFCLTGPTWLYFVCCTYYFLCTLIYFYNSRNSSRTPVYSMSYNPAENCVLICTVSFPSVWIVMCMVKVLHLLNILSVGRSVFVLLTRGYPRKQFHFTWLECKCYAGEYS